MIPTFILDTQITMSLYEAIEIIGVIGVAVGSAIAAYLHFLTRIQNLEFNDRWIKANLKAIMKKLEVMPVVPKDNEGYDN